MLTACLRIAMRGMISVSWYIIVPDWQRFLAMRGLRYRAVDTGKLRLSVR